MPLSKHTKLDQAKLREKALRIKMKAQLRNQVCIRIQKQCRKHPDVARALAGMVTLRLLEGSSTSSKDPSDEEFAKLVQEAIDTRAANAPPTHKLRHNSNNDNRQNSDQSNRKGNRKGSLDTTHAMIYQTEAQIQQASVGFQLDDASRVSPSKVEKRDIWSNMVQASTAEAEAEAERKKQEALKNRAHWVDELERQKSLLEAKKEAEELENRRFYQISMAKMERENARELEKEAARVALAKEQSVAQAKQRLAKEALRLRDEELRARQEQELVARIKRQQALDEEKEVLKKHAEKQKMMRVLDENQVFLDRKARAKEDERQYELRLAEEYVAMEEKKDNARKKALEDLSTKIQAKMKYFNDTSKAEANEKEKQEEMRLLKYQLEYEANKAEQEQAKERQRQNRNAAQQAELKRQMSHKLRQEQAVREEFNQQAQIWNREQTLAQKKERANANKRYMRNKMQQQWLRDQMQEKERQKLIADHTPLEIQLNKSILMKIQQGQDVVDDTKLRAEGLSLLK